MVAKAWWNTPPRQPDETWEHSLPGSKNHFRMRARQFLATLARLSDG